MQEPVVKEDPYHGYKELTIRGIVLGVFITILFMASNIYLGLKVGLTFASAIPAAVLSMAVLRYVKGANILENNLVQTQASASGTLSAVIFVLPGLLMMGYWQNFPFWQVSLICLSGGILGALFTIPLRRTMVVNSDLPFPEGIAAAEILKAGASGKIANEKGEIIQDEQNNKTQNTHINEIVYGGICAAIANFLSGGLKVIHDSASIWFKSGSAIFQIPMGFSLALLGAGSLIGIRAGLAMLVGLIVTWFISVPVFSMLYPQPEHIEMIPYAKQLWSEKVRFMGVGTIGVAAIWTLLLLFKPLIASIKMSLGARKENNLNLQRADQDLSPKTIFTLALGMLIILALTFHHFVSVLDLSPLFAWTMVGVVTLVTFVMGFLISAACAYMSGLVGSSSSPISSIGILTVIVLAVILLALGHSFDLTTSTQGVQFLTALTLFGTSAVLAIATIANDNLQDLKTGYLIHATPKHQQTVLIIGSVVGSLVISPVLELLYNAYGFSGAMPRENMDVGQALAAPQATLMTTITQGIFAQNLQWNYIFIGIVIGIGFIIFDFLLKYFSNKTLTLPVLAVGMGIYLPPTVTMPLFIGAVLFWIIQRLTKNKESKYQKDVEQKGTLFAAGLIVGESLMGVLLAMIIVFSVSKGGSDAPLALGLEGWSTAGDILGFISFLVVMFIFYRRCLK